MRLVLHDTGHVLNVDQMHVGVLPAGPMRTQGLARRSVQQLPVPASVRGERDLEGLLGLRDVLGPVLRVPAGRDVAAHEEQGQHEQHGGDDDEGDFHKEDEPLTRSGSSD
jgi:hypothetical protein